MGLHILFSKINLIFFIPVILKAVMILFSSGQKPLSLQLMYSLYTYIICLVSVLRLTLSQVISEFKTPSPTNLVQSYIFLEPYYCYRADMPDMSSLSTNSTLVWQEIFQ